MNKSIYDKLKIIGIKTLRCGTHLFSFFPIKKGRVLLSSYLGESYSCNPKYISEYLQKIIQKNLKSFGHLKILINSKIFPLVRL